jgi:hypothetical protein
MHKFLDTYNLPNVLTNEIENFNRLITCEEIESLIKNLSTKKISGPTSFTGELYQTFEEQLHQIPQN